MSRNWKPAGGTVADRITLSDSQRQRALFVGKARAEYNHVRGHRHVNNLPAGEFARDLAMHTAGAEAEMAAWLYLGPEKHVWHDLWTDGEKSEADIDDNIDVKAVNAARKRLIVPRGRRVDTHAYLSVVKEDAGRFWIRGWRWGAEMTKIIQLTPGRPCYVAENADLRDPALLK